MKDIKNIIRYSLILLLVGCSVEEVDELRETSVSSLILTGNEGNCLRIMIGLDQNHNGILDLSEYKSNQLICPIETSNGLNSLSNISKINDCVQIQSGLDTNKNDILDDNEILQTEEICPVNGEDGQNSLIRIEDENPGTNCVDGGVVVHIGLDTNKNNTLDDNEIQETQYICAVRSIPVEPCKEEEIIQNIDFENYNAGNGLDKIIIEQDISCDQTISVFGFRPYCPENLAVILDTSDPMNGVFSSSYLGNVLMVSDRNISGKHSHAKTVYKRLDFVFEIPSYLVSIDLVGVDKCHKPKIKMYDIDNHLLKEIVVESSENNSIQTIFLEQDNVSKLQIWQKNSKAVDNLRIKCNSICE